VRGKLQRSASEKCKPLELKEERAEAERIRRLRLRDELHSSRGLYRNHNDRLTELRRGAAEKFPREIERTWEILALALESERMDESAYCLAAGMADPYHV
jgi:hypothetical protein